MAMEIGVQWPAPEAKLPITLPCAPPVKREMTKPIDATLGRITLKRRDFLKCAAATTALAAAARALLPSGAYAAPSGPEVKGAKLGYIALTDSAPLIVAKEKGLYAKYGVPDVMVEKQASWGATRDNMALGGASGGIDGGHILRPKAHLYSSGAVMQNNQPLPMYTLLNLNEDCQGISVAQAYADTGVTLDAGALMEAFARRRAEGKTATAAMTASASESRGTSSSSTRTSGSPR